MNEATGYSGAVDPRAIALLDFWFGPRAETGWAQGRKAWWEKDETFDRACRDGFLAIHEAAALGRHDDWMATPEGTLALTLLMDQLPRNMFRGTPRMYATDARARELTRHTIAEGFDCRLTPIQTLFAWIPFEHSEILEDQDRNVAWSESVYKGPERDNVVKSAHRHREIIARFGRFPHRNEILGRESTAEEVAFLKEPDSSF